MRVLVAGDDGFCGWPTAPYLSSRSHEIAIADNLIRREWDRELGTESQTEISSIDDRLARWKELSGKSIKNYDGDLTDADFVFEMMDDFKHSEVFEPQVKWRSARYR